jgi:hypothetical protein
MVEPTDAEVEAWAYTFHDPVAFVSRAIGVKPQGWQKRVLRDLDDPNVTRIAVKSCHGPGKTTVAAWAIHYWLNRYPYSKVPCTAPTEHQLFDNLWPELYKWMRQSEFRIGDWMNWTRTRLAMKQSDGTDEPEWYAAGRVSRVTKTGTSDQGEAYGLQGFHAPQLLFVVDEASGVPDPVFASIEGALATGQAKILAIGNPNVPAGWFWKAFHREQSEWSLHSVSYKDSPRVSKAWAESMIRRYGLKHPWVQVRVLGEFPTAAEHGLVGLWSWERATDPQTHERLSGIGRRALGIDVARYGKNNSVIAFATGPVVHRLDSHPQTSITELEGLVKVAIDEHEPEFIVVDADGVGGGLVDNLRDAGIPNLISWHEGGGAKRNKKFLNARAELAWLFKEAIEDEALAVPASDDAEAQAVNIKYKIRRDGKIQLESKEELAKRMDSPDEFDAVRYSLVPYLLGAPTADGAIVPAAKMSEDPAVPMDLLLS